MGINVSSSRCGNCNIDSSELKLWIQKRFFEGYSTMELLTSATAEERLIISIVALVDVDDDALCEMIKGKDYFNENILSCRRNAKNLLKRML